MIREFQLESNLKLKISFETESLRKYPPCNLIRTNVNKEYPIPGTNIVMPKESLVIVPVYAIHHDPDYYTNPEEFNPDRFEPEEVKKRHPQTFLSFGDGYAFIQIHQSYLRDYNAPLFFFSFLL